MSQAGITRGILGPLLAIPVLFGALYPLQRRIDRQEQTVQQQKEELLLRSGPLLKKLSLGYEPLLADIYWTRAVQYYGGKRRDQDPNLELLDTLLDVTVTLDPQLVVAYKFGAIFLAEPSPQGAARPDLAVRLVRRGIAANPDEWRFWADLGFTYYWYLQDYTNATDAYLQGSKHPKAPLWMKTMAARIAAEGASREVSRALWSQIFEATQDPIIRRNAAEHLDSLAAQEDIDQLEKFAAKYASRTGHFPRSMGELVAAGLLRSIPLDPAGHAYVLGPEGKAHLDSSSPIKLDILKPRAHPQ